MAKHVPQQKIDDCRELYLRHGGLGHDLIVAEMHARGWHGFTKRNLYARTRAGRVEPGWPERFGWDGEIFTAETRRRRAGRRGQNRSARCGRATGPILSLRLSVSAVRRTRGKHGVAYANRSAREHTPSPRPAALTIPDKPKFNRQKARRLRRERERRVASTAETQGRGEAKENRPQINADNADRSGNKLIDPDLRPSAAKLISQRLCGSAVEPATDDGFHAWLKTLPGAMNWDWRHQIYLYERLKKVTDGTCKRLMIFMPPRHGKSELVTVRYSAWRLKQDPSLNVILGSYNQRLANRFSRKIKRVLCDDALSTAEAQRRGEEVGTANERGLVQNVGAPHNRNGKSGPDSLPQRLSDSAVDNTSPFPFAKQRPINTVAEWETTMGGGLRAVGVGAGVTGYGAKLIVIDDPVKSREQANSERYREKLWDWYQDDLRTRLEPGGAIILIQTRWHEDDLAGRLLREAENDGDQWEIVSLPALAEDLSTAETQSRGEAEENWPQINAESADKPGDDPIDPDLLHLRPSAAKLVPPRLSDSAVDHPVDELGRRPGEALCPQRYTQEELERIRAAMNEYSFAALYQQRPVPQEGGVFKRAWFTHIVDHAPQGLKWKRGYDLAVSTKQTADYTASFRVAFDGDGNLYIDGGYRRRIPFPEQRRYMIERMRVERDTEHGIELALHGKAVMQDLRRLPGLFGQRFVGVPVKGDKQQRALSWLRLAEEGRIRLVRGHWIKQFVEEAAAFPHGKHDDQIDAVSLAVSMHERKPSKLYTC